MDDRTDKWGGADLVGAYLASVAAGEREASRARLERAAHILTDGTATASTLVWPKSEGLVPALRGLAAAHGIAPEEQRAMVAAVRGVMRAAKRAGLLTAEAERRALGYAPVVRRKQGETRHDALVRALNRYRPDLAERAARRAAAGDDRAEGRGAA